MNLRAWSACVLVLLGGMAAMPRTAEAGAWQPGLRAGMSLATIRGDFADLVDPDLQFGLAGGPFVTWQPSPRFGLQAEALYVRKGATIRGEYVNFVGEPTPYEGHLNLDYLEIPLLARVTLAPSGVLGPYLVAGPSFGITLHGRFVTGGAFTDQDLEDMKSVDVGLAGGFGVAFPAGDWKALVEARYTGGLFDLYDIAGNLESINSAWTFTLGITR